MDYVGNPDNCSITAGVPRIGYGDCMLIIKATLLYFIYLI